MNKLAIAGSHIVSVTWKMQSKFVIFLTINFQQKFMKFTIWNPFGITENQLLRKRGQCKGRPIFSTFGTRSGSTGRLHSAPLQRPQLDVNHLPTMTSTKRAAASGSWCVCIPFTWVDTVLARESLEGDFQWIAACGSNAVCVVFTRCGGGQVRSSELKLWHVHKRLPVVAFLDDVL